MRFDEGEGAPCPVCGTEAATCRGHDPRAQVEPREMVPQDAAQRRGPGPGRVLVTERIYTPLATGRGRRLLARPGEYVTPEEAEALGIKRRVETTEKRPAIETTEAPTAPNTKEEADGEDDRDGG